MKKLIAKRRGKKDCIICGISFNRGDIYYNKRNIINDYDDIIAWTDKYCPKCKYKKEQQDKRFEIYKQNCEHPKIVTKWHMYAPGQYEPDYDYCVICEKILD